MRDEPPRGALLRLERVELPALEGCGAGSGPERERWRRDNVARRCVRLVYPDGAPAGVGLFVATRFAEEYARERGWTVLPGPVDAAHTIAGGWRR